MNKLQLLKAIRVMEHLKILKKEESYELIIKVIDNNKLGGYNISEKYNQGEQE